MKTQMALAATLALSPMACLAQAGDTNDTSGTRTERGPVKGDRELTIAGTGSSDQDVDNGTYGISGDIGWYLSDNFQLGLRQSFNYVQVEGGDDRSNGATRAFVNYHFDLGAARPFVGLSAGGIYGDGVDDTGFGGPEAGLKYYVRQKTFLFARAEYQYFFESSDDIEDNFEDGSFAYGVGVGYHF